MKTVMIIQHLSSCKQATFTSAYWSALELSNDRTPEGYISPGSQEGVSYK